MIVLMWLGRLEIIPVVVLLTRHYWRAVAPLARRAEERRGADRDRRRSSGRPRAPGRRAACTVAGSTSSVRPCRNTEMRRDPAGSARPPDLLARGRRAALDLHLDDDEPLLLELEQPDEPVLGDLVLDEAEDARRRAHGLRDPEQVEVLLVARVVDARDRLRARRSASFAICEMTRLSSSSPVTASRSSGGRAMPARSSTLISVASPRITTGPNSSSSRAKRSGALLDQRDLVPELEQRARRRSSRPSLRPRRRRTSDGASLRASPRARCRGATEIAVCVGQTMLMPRSRVELRPRRVEDPHDDACRSRSASAAPGR